MDDKRYLETIENDYDLPNGIYWAEWYKYGVTFKAFNSVYTLIVTKFQNSPNVPVTLQVIGRLIDIYLGHIKE
jgi:hypothetical protein